MVPRVLHLITHLEPGGIETWLLSMLREIPRRRCVIDICCKGPAVGSLAPIARDLGAHVHHCRLRPTHLGYLTGVTRLLREGGYHLAHVHLGAYAGLGVFAARRAKRRSLCTFHSTSFEPQTWTRLPLLRQLRSAYASLSIRYALARADRVTGTSAAILDSLRAAYHPAERTPFRVLQLGVQVPELPEPSDREELRQELDFRPGLPLLVHVGSFRPEKNHQAVLDVFERVSRQAEVGLVLVGDGALRPAIESLARRRGLWEQVRFLGRRPDAIDVMRRCDVLLMPSRSEGFGLVAVEAGAAGLPVVSSDAGGLPEAVEDGVTGFVLAVDDIAGMADKTRELLNDHELAQTMGERGRQRALAEFSRAAAAQRLLELYDDCLRGDHALRSDT